MRKLAGFGLLFAGYTLAWWSFNALTGRVRGTVDANAWLPSFVDLMVPGRLSPPPISGLSIPASQDLVNRGALNPGTPGSPSGPPLQIQPQPGMYGQA